MKRYGLFYLRGHDGEMEEADEGEWVKYKDVAALENQVAEIQRIAHESLRERDTALAALGQVQAAAADMLAAADALLKERDHYRAVCVLADALRNKERGL